MGLRLKRLPQDAKATKSTLLSASRYDPDGVNNPGDISQNGQQDVEPELKAKSHLEEHTDRRKQHRQNQARDVSDGHGGLRSRKMSGIVWVLCVNSGHHRLLSQIEVLSSLKG